MEDLLEVCNLYGVSDERYEGRGRTDSCGWIVGIDSGASEEGKGKVPWIGL
jgi:hypothetical protein